MPRCDKCLGCDGDYVEMQWNGHTIKRVVNTTAENKQTKIYEL